MPPARAANSSSRQYGSNRCPPSPPRVPGAEMVTSGAQSPHRVPQDNLDLTQGLGLNIPKQPFYFPPNSNLNALAGYALAGCVERGRNLKKVECFKLGLFNMYSLCFSPNPCGKINASNSADKVSKNFFHVYWANSHQIAIFID